MDSEFEAADLTTILALREEGPDRFTAEAASYPWGRVYGGLVVAQGAAAAARTVDPRFRIHSLHAYFIRGGVCGERIEYEIDRIRDGRSFCTRRVVAHQPGGAILNLSASFQVDEAGAVDVQGEALPEGVPGPEDVEDSHPEWSRILENRSVPLEDSHGRSRHWIRVRQDLGDDEVLNACGLAYASDDVLIDAAARCHPRCPSPDDETTHHHDLFMAASLDHAIWFHRPLRADQWILHDVRASGLRGGRGLATARLFDREGRHVASVTQECLLRERDPQ